MEHFLSQLYAGFFVSKLDRITFSVKIDLFKRKPAFELGHGSLIIASLKTVNAQLHFYIVLSLQEWLKSEIKDSDCLP